MFFKFAWVLLRVKLSSLSYCPRHQDGPASMPVGRENMKEIEQGLGQMD